MQKRKLAKVILAAASGLLAANAMAIGPGLYMGVMMGPANNGANPQPVQIQSASDPAGNNLDNSTAPPLTINSSGAVTSTGIPIPTYTQIGNPSSTQFGTRAYLGYKFNTYAGFELGFTFFSGIQFQVSQNPNTVSPSTPIVNPNGGAGGGSPVLYPFKSPYTAAAGTTARVRLVDLLAKLDYSYNDTIGIFAKAGVAAAYVTVPGALQPTTIHYSQNIYPNAGAINTKQVQLIRSGSNKYLTKLAPAFAIGASYDLNQSWQMDISWTRYFIGSQVKNMNLYALGLSYHFVDVYCGSFLCGN